MICYYFNEISKYSQRSNINIKLYLSLSLINRTSSEKPKRSSSRMNHQLCTYSTRLYFAEFIDKPAPAGAERRDDAMVKLHSVHSNIITSEYHYQPCQQCIDTRKQVETCLCVFESTNKEYNRIEKTPRTVADPQHFCDAPKIPTYVIGEPFH